MRRLHRLLNHLDELFAQLTEINAIAQRCAECCQRSRRIVLATIETAVDDGLDAAALRLDKGGSHEGRGNNNQRRLRFRGKVSHQKLQPDNQAKIDEAEYDSQRTVDQRAIDNNINIPQ